MRRFVPFAVLASLVALSAPAGTAVAQGVSFTEGRPFAEALRRARAEKKPLMVDTYAVWCGPCKQLDRMTFADAAVGAWARKNVIAVKVDAEKGEGRRISQRYAVRAFPTVLFIDASGDELDRISGVFPPVDFVRAGDAVLAGQTPITQTIGKLRSEWEPALAGNLAAQLAQRNDLSRLREVARLAVEKDPELAERGAREAFLYLVSVEDGAGKVSAETLDLIDALAARLAPDPRVVILRLAASREQARQGDAAAARASALAGLKGLPDDSPFASDLYAALAAAEQTGKKPAAALAAARKAVALGEQTGGGGARARASRQLTLAEALAFAGQPGEARKTVDAALPPGSSDPALLTRASSLLLRLEDLPAAVAYARRAVETSQGGDAGAQEALGVALAASGDARGAAEALTRAVELEPENAAARKRLDALRSKKGAKGATAA
jgi:thiol-disulfide isomerase/thioredoxin